MDARKKFGVVGGGLMGLTLALRLAERGYRVTVLEAADHLGGLADAWQLGDVTWDRHYHVTLESDAYLRRLLKELGLDQEMQWVRTRTGFLVDGRLHSLSSVWDFVRFPPLGLFDKARLAWTIWQASRRRDWKALEQLPVGDWLKKHSGRRTFERIWLPLLKAKLGDAWRRTSAAFIWATIQRMYAARHSGQKLERFGYLPGGYARTLAALAEQLERRGVRVETSCRVTAVERLDDGSLEVHCDDGRALAFDRVVSTLPAPLSGKVCECLTPEERERLSGIEYVGIVCASLLLKRPLTEFYVTNITDVAPFTGVIDMTALVEPRAFGGRGLVYLPKYVTADDPAARQSDERIETEFLTALARLFPTFSPADVLAFRVSRVKQVFALSTLGYSRRVPPTRTSVPGLYIVNSAQIVNGTLNVNETVRLAESSLDVLCEPQASDPTQSQRAPIFGPQLETYDQAARELVARPG
jgi:protoporphyrinogen oxidase